MRSFRSSNSSTRCDEARENAADLDPLSAPSPSRSGQPEPIRTSAKNSVLRRAAREPLVHFVLLGLALFVVDVAVRRRPSREPASRQIVLTLDDLRQLQLGFAAQWQRPPKGEELYALIENRIQEEVLYREALAMGLDKDDTIVRRRMAQKMEFLAEDVASAREPTSEELKTWFAKNAALFSQSARASFRLLYFSPDKRGLAARADAVDALPKLSGKTSTWPGAARLGDRFMLSDFMADRAPDQVARDFGPPFARELFAQKPGVWTGPIESGYGWHLVFLESLTPERVPAFEEVEPEVKTAWLGAQKTAGWEEAYKKMRAKYEVLLPAPPEEAVPVKPAARP